jgi:hypothetical protein
MYGTACTAQHEGHSLFCTDTYLLGMARALRNGWTGDCIQQTVLTGLKPAVYGLESRHVMVVAWVLTHL